ncbi:unnamed protein product [Staurois parvus]|uniref:Uncharacterized protein n=1 Tax=Staurois parvus TaxID=386267 RepID=A0ABN9BVB9_9NEOB|nr:unnamed protein product [Staurois parvus]
MVANQLLTSACSIKVFLNPEPCIHYIWSPTDPAFTICGLSQYTEHRNAIILVNINC